MRDEILKTAELIKAHENGAHIQWRKRGSNNPWLYVGNPSWAITKYEYRIKEYTDTERLDFLSQTADSVTLTPSGTWKLECKPFIFQSSINIREYIDEFIRGIE